MKLGFNLHLSPKHMFFFLHYTTLSGFCSLPRKKIKEEKNTAAKLRVRGKETIYYTFDLLQYTRGRTAPGRELG